MKALRRSMKGADRHKPQSPSIGSKSAVAIVPPKKVIRANDDCHPDDALVQTFAKAGVQVLSFSKGDFFHVIGREDDPGWYEACNPALPDARGLVPVAYFQVLGRTERDSAQSDGGRLPPPKSQDHDSGYGETALQSPSPSAPSQRSSKPTKASGTVYAKVCHTFEADPSRPDELSAQEGENLIIIAQSNHEWVVAKPIMRLGGPGLIPLSFIDLYNEVHVGVDAARAPAPVGDPLEALRKASVPSVEEWKRMAAQYKNSSITLGKFDGVRNPAAPQQPGIEQAMARMSMQQAGARHSSQRASQAGYQGHALPVPRDSYAAANSASDSGTPVWARIPRYCFAEEKYWFVIEAEFPDGRCWELARYYQDFYDFQIALLAEFPVEAGNAGSKKRTLPYMPGPVSYVTDAITEGRLYNLDAYIKNLLNQPEHISQCHLVKLFFTPRDGDYEIDANDLAVDEYRLSEGSRQSSSVESPANTASRRSSPNDSNGYGYSGLTATPRQGTNSHQGAAAQAQGQQNQPPASAMKIKVRFKDDVFAMRVATDIQFQELQDKIRDRVKAVPSEQVQLFYQDEPSGSLQNMMSDNDLDVALQRNEKLTVYVEVV